MLCEAAARKMTNDLMGYMHKAIDVPGNTPLTTEAVKTSIDPLLDYLYGYDGGIVFA